MTKPHNPWEEFLNNCATGDNHFRSSEYQELIDFIDGIQAENAALRQESVALKEQVAQLQDLNENHAFNAKYFKAASEKSAALVDALEGLLSLDEENHQRYPGDEDVCLEVRNARAALAEFKGAK